MMKWKVTRSPRCASADRSSEYLRTIELPDASPLRSPLGSQQYEKEPLTENRKGNELFRKPSFAATDCINLKGIFGLSKDRGDAPYSSLGVLNPAERQRSRSEVRGSSADRFSFAYHGNQLSISQLPLQGNGPDKGKESSAAKKPRGSSPGDKGKSCWVRGRRREREPRKPLLGDDDYKGTRTVVTSSKGPAPKKITNGKTSLDGSGFRTKAKAKKKERSISKEKGNARGKENKEVNNNDDDRGNVKIEIKTSGALPQNLSSVNKPKRIIRKKGQAPKPQQAQLQKESNVTSEQTCESSCKENGTEVQPIEHKSEMQPSVSDPDVNMTTNIECNGNNSVVNELKMDKFAENIQENLSETHATKLTVRAEVHFENPCVNDEITNGTTETVEDKDEDHKTSNNKIKEETNTQRTFYRFCKATSNIKQKKFLPIIDEPDYTPTNSDGEIDKNPEVDEEIVKKRTIDDQQIMDEDTEGDEEEEEERQKLEESSSSSAADDFKTPEQILICEQINVDTDHEIICKEEFEESDVVNQSMDMNGTLNESSELPVKESNTNSENSSNEECNVSNDDITDTTELDDTALLDMSSDTLMGFPSTMDDSSPTSPTPPPRKKMSLLQQQLQQLMTVNVVVRNPPPANGTNISLTSPVINNVPTDFMAKKKKSFVLTVAKQEEGFRSLCASRDFLPGEGPLEVSEVDENRISVTFLCSGPPSESWLDNPPPLKSKKRSVSVPPKNVEPQNEFISLMTPSQRNGSKDRRTKDRQNPKRKSHRGRKKDAVFHMPQAVIDELSQVLETRKRVPDDKVC